MASCLLCTAILCVLLTTVATIVAFATPSWLNYVSVVPTLCQCIGDCNCGLWIQCIGGDVSSWNNCAWYFDDNFRLENYMPDWFKAVQGLFSCAVASSLLALLISICSLCCFCKGCNPHHVTSAFINLTFLLLGIAVCLFGAKSYMEHSAEVIKSVANPLLPVFGWSFWVGVGATGMALISSILFFCVGRTDDY